MKVGDFVIIVDCSHEQFKYWGYETGSVLKIKEIINCEKSCSCFCLDCNKKLLNFEEIKNNKREGFCGFRFKKFNREEKLKRILK